MTWLFEEMYDKESDYITEIYGSKIEYWRVVVARDED